MKAIVRVRVKPSHSCRAVLVSDIALTFIRVGSNGEITHADVQEQKTDEPPDDMLCIHVASMGLIAAFLPRL